MSTDRHQDPDPAAHYDHVHEAWRIIMGEEFHYGYFDPPALSLPEATAELTAQMRRRADVQPGDRVLDVGSGTGRQSCDLGADLGAKVLGITTSEEGVAAGNALAARRGLDDVRFERRDGTANGLDDGSFDVVWALESSHLMRDRRALLGECVRVLAPGGRLVLCDIIRKREIPFREVRDRREEFATLRSAHGDAHMEPLEDYVATLTELGADVGEHADISRQTEPTFAAWRANIADNEDEVVGLLGREGVDDFVRATEILEAFWADGTLGYGILLARVPA